ncbi:NAD-dependent epimerase/dehydratase family protein [Lactiplantibacillus plantarum]|uniref:NAD-dependent epimerase/dehydratase family protein n=1 Tax=Lactiplantibacillus plantarum TaxID=1590 RepID=UPI000629F36A|nr:NAD-dependent epimerase/dehydratase family protein [Lactiplantibacillus plantarum]KZT92547.1 dTDP-glucose 4 6-dehydratase [Lactiplantibacillus plantarum]KZT99860.1 dTDP-glucose 4 6-dehydratase [Lactiplantibacillus plantarum]MCG0640282.1 UDP-glucose 4-epimerase [Lactiplantibacillus plantarum]MCG0865896.1 UDP-glucose 4-epimerase [Lactiplantibacillus plantarum]RXE82107.1 SDR family NAD(P)-dependent oxidoreductase [Lactiplantibacillus plantarum]
MKALVTGGAGFIGSHLVDHLVESGFEVVVVDDLSMGAISNIKHWEQITIYVADVCDDKFMQQLLADERPDYIYFLAAIASVADSIERPAETHAVNHTAVFNLLEHIRQIRLPIKQFLFTSSAAVYGNLPELPKREDSRVAPVSPYAIDKYATERFVLAYGELYDLPTVCVRFFNVYGPRQNPSSPYSGVLSILTDCLKTQRPFTLFGDGTQTRDFVYVSDVIKALWLITEHQVQHEVINIANGLETSLNGIIQMYQEIAGQQLEIKRAEQRGGEVDHSVASIGKLTRLNYESEWPLRRGLTKYWEGECEHARS